MPITVNQSPEFPIPGAQVRLTFGPTTGTYVRVWCTSAPLGSILDTKLQAEGSSRLQVFEADVRQTWTLDADMGGRYSFLVQEYSRLSFTGGYKADPDGYRTETKVGSEVSVDVYVGDKWTGSIGFGADESKVVLWVWNETIRATTVADQGEVSPRIDPGATEAAKNACRATTVTAALAALVGVSASSAVGSTGTVLDDIISKFNAHLTQGGVHSSNDTDNSIASAYASPYNANPSEQLTAVFERVRAHMANDARDGDGPVAGYHGASDRLNVFLSGPPSDKASAYAFAADLWRVYEAHRVLTTSGTKTIHSTADTTNTAAALPKLMDVHRYFLAELAKTSPSASPGQQTGSALLAAIGMQKA